MSALLLVPYNDSMRLGQGYNSFLQTPCVHGAVEIGDAEDSIVETSPGEVSQTVSYSSRFVNKISEVVRSMNISAGTSIKTGSVTVSGNSLNVDELKFTASDLNAVVSVKVVNQQMRLRDDATFVPPKFPMDSDKFHDRYGDSYISGFVEGGDLHGIVSIKVLDASKKEKIKTLLKGQINGAEKTKFSLSKAGGMSGISSALKETETTVSVNWSGGGQIKAESEEWSLESLMRVAAAFPAKVAACPQRTYAILTKYDTNLHFLAYATKNRIRIRDYAVAQRYTSDLLDMYMEYKNNIAVVQNVLGNPTGYRISPVSNALNISVADLIKERSEMKKQMSAIVVQIDEINKKPKRVGEVESKSTILPPEIWATRLPLRKEEVATKPTDMSFSDIMRGFPIMGAPPSSTPAASNPAPSATQTTSGGLLDQARRETEGAKNVVQEAIKLKSDPVPPTTPETDPFAPPPPPMLYDAKYIGPSLLQSERDVLSTDAHRKAWGNYRFDAPQGNSEENVCNFNDCETLEKTSVPATWPTRIEIQMVAWNAPNQLVGHMKVTYDQVQLAHGSTRGLVLGTLILDLAPGEWVDKMKMSKGKRVWNVNGVSYVEVSTNRGQRKTLGTEVPGETIEYYPYDGCVGLKGFFGREGDVLDRMGPIWGKP